jgi:hypothetical protein
MSTPKLNLYPITGINVYAIPIPELVKKLQHATNDETYKGAGEEECQDTDLSTSKLSTSNVDVDVTSPSDTPSTSNVIPIGKRHTIYK